MSTLDLGGHGSFTLFTGIGGDVWAQAATTVAAELGLDLPVVSIGPGQPYEDPYGTWAGLREIADDGVILARPDLYVAFRAEIAPASAAEAATRLSQALRTVLAAPIPG